MARGDAAHPVNEVTEIPMGGRELEAAIADMCQLLGLLHYHTHDSRRSPPGFPDFVIASTRGVLFREVKGTFRNGRGDKLTHAQISWLNALQETGQDVAVWRAADWHSGRIERELEALRPPR